MLYLAQSSVLLPLLRDGKCQSLFHSSLKVQQLDVLIETKTKDNVIVRDLMQTGPIAVFKSKWKDVPKANGKENPKNRNDSHKNFKWDAVRFSHKVYAIFDAAKNVDADVLIWMDADTVCHSTLPLDFLDKFISDVMPKFSS